MDGAVLDLAAATTLDREAVGGKVAVLADLLSAGFAVPPGFVVPAAAQDDPGLQERLADAARRLGADQFAVRSSAVAEDLPDASYAGLYETYLNVPVSGLGEAVHRCFAAAESDRVTAYQRRHGARTAAMAVLVQVMIDAVAAGVAFTAHPVTGNREQAVVTAVSGLGDPLVSGDETGEEWTVTTAATLTRPGPGAALAASQAEAVAVLARRVAHRYAAPQDIEWAIDSEGRLWLVQARPMTALPDSVSWTPTGPGLWMRNFRLGEWLPEAVTPLFATWLLPALEDGYLDGMHESVGVRVPFRWALVNGWYYNATPVLSLDLPARVLLLGGHRAVNVLFNAIIRVNCDPAAADRAALSDLARRWQEDQAPRYRNLVATAEAEADHADPAQLVTLVDQLGREAGTWLWYLAIVGGSAWKMEACLTRFTRQHLASVLPDADGGAQVLLRGLPGTEPALPRHAVSSVDWYHPVAAEQANPPSPAGHRHTELAAQRAEAHRRVTAALASRPELLARYQQLVEVTQRYTVLRERQARDFTLAWPALRTCAQRLGRHLADAGVIDHANDIFFCTRTELDASLAGNVRSLNETVTHRHDNWQRERRLAAPLTIGHPAPLVGDIIERAARHARGPIETGDDVLVGHPASAGQATGPVRIITDPGDFPNLTAGDILVAPTTTPAWTPLFALAAAVVTDGGTLAAHASLVAREYGIPAVVGTGTATHRLRTGQQVTVNGTAGTVKIQHS